jgi:Zn-dependent protease with chaperone function
MRVGSAALALTGLLAACENSARNATQPSSVDGIQQMIESVRQASFPLLSRADIAVYDLRSDSDYLQARFTVSSFFSGKLQYLVFFNQEAIRRQVPADGLRAIVAHELAHISYYEHQSRMGLLSLAGLLVPSFSTRFERKADLDAIALGYGRGLETFRIWLYRNIPPARVASKKRDYYTPEEIEALLRAEMDHPGIMNKFQRCTPRSLAEIDKEVRSPAGDCPK